MQDAVVSINSLLLRRKLFPRRPRTPFPTSVKTCSLAAMVLSVAACAGAQTVSQNTPSSVERKDDQQAITQLRTIADEIKKCPQRQIANGDGSSVQVDVPLNVVWDVQPQESARTEKIGYIEFVQHSSYIPSEPEPCRKHDDACQRRNQATQEVDAIRLSLNLPDNFRYEFDFGPKGLEFLRALKKHEADDATHWLAMNPGNGCEAKAVWTVLGRR